LKTRRISARMAKRITGAGWRLHVPTFEAPPGQVDFVRYPWIASNEKLKAELGWTPRYTSRETLEIALRAKGMGAPAPAAAAPAPPPPVTPVAG
jgi:nucleoside-diphosphate-sugar epimerase